MKEIDQATVDPIEFLHEDINSGDHAARETGADTKTVTFHAAMAQASA